MKRTLLAVALACLATSAIADECRYTARRQANESTAGIERIKIVARRGTLRIEGQQGGQTLVAEGKACATDEDDLSEVQLQTRREGTTLIVETVMPELSAGSFLGLSNETWLDFRLDVPSNVRLDIDDTTGETSIRNVGVTTVRDSSGELRIEAVSGDLTVEDNSGAVHISRVTGDVSVRDDSGELHISDVTGNVSIPSDGSGEVRIAKVQGNVHIASDGSGAMSIEGVRNNVRIDDDGSGAIYVRDVGGNVTVGSDGSGDLDVEEVRGSLVVEAGGSGAINHRNVAGKVSVPNRR